MGSTLSTVLKILRSNTSYCIVKFLTIARYYYISSTTSNSVSNALLMIPVDSGSMKVIFVTVLRSSLEKDVPTQSTPNEIIEKSFIS